MPIVWSKKMGDDTELAIWKISESAGELYRQLQLNDDEKLFYAGLNHGKRNLHWLGSRVLLRTLINTSLYIDCQLDENNKPYLVNFPYEISITHSNDMAAVILSKGRRAGIDIEKMSDKINRIAERFMSRPELDFIKEETRIEQLYACWGAKESLFKLYGKGNLPFIDGIVIDEFEYPGNHKLKASIHKPDYRKTFEVEYLVFGEYMLTWVLEP